VPRSSKAVKRYLKWTSVTAEVFNVGKYRREATPNPDAAFFDTNHTAGEKARRAAAEAAVEDMLLWFRNTQHKVAILDATNSTKQRREWILNKIKEHGGLLRKFIIG
jgi:6-phosphofructo-2-kinase / fructose-2,6-biphosphatase 2